jgi:hypothetical protein
MAKFWVLDGEAKNYLSLAKAYPTDTVQTKK